MVDVVGSTNPFFWVLTQTAGVAGVVDNGNNTLTLSVYKSYAPFVENYLRSHGHNFSLTSASTDLLKGLYPDPITGNVYTIIS